MKISGKLSKLYKGCPKANGWFAGLLEIEENDDIKEIKVTGMTPLPIEEGIKIECDGEETIWNDDSQFKLSRISFDLTDTRTQNRYLHFIAPELSEEMRCKIIMKYKSDILNAIKNKTKNLVTLGVPKKVATRMKVRAIKDDLKNEIYQIIPLSESIIDLLIIKYEDKALNIIKEDPYILYIEYDVNFDLVDKTALKLGIKPDSEIRINAVIYNEFMKIINFLSDTFLVYSNPKTKWTLCSRAAKYLDINTIDNMSIAKHIPKVPYLKFRKHNDELLLYSKRIFDAETKCVQNINDIIEENILTKHQSGLTEKEIKNQKYTERDLILKCAFLNGLIDEYEQKNKISLDREQRIAVLQAMLNRISIINGKAGSGKTTVIKCILYLWKKICKYQNIPVMVAPTGKAVQRIKESVKNNKYYYHTVAHYAYKFRFSPTEQEEISDTLVIVDETSMLGLEEASDFLSLCTKSQLVFIGDTNQLPSVSIGSFFKDIINFDKNPKTTLSICHRSESKTILENADKVNAGEEFNKLKLNVDEFIAYPYLEDNEDMVKDILQIYRAHLAEGSDLAEIAILTPMRKHIAGANNLNILLQDILNPAIEEDDNLLQVSEMKHIKRGYPIKDARQYGLDGKISTLRVGDRVMCTQNINDITVLNEKGESIKDGVANGECGTIISFQTKTTNGRTVQMFEMKTDDNRTIIITRDYYDKIVLAYAMTIHKSQGNEYRHVILVLPNQLNDLPPTINFATKNLVYTAITRARKTLEIIGSISAFNNCVKTPMRDRNSILTTRLISCAEWKLKSR